MTYFGYTAAGEKVNLGAPVSVIINRDEDAPADDFTGIFPAASAMPPITAVRAFRGEELAFNGIVDEQTVQTTSNDFERQHLQADCAKPRRLAFGQRSFAANLHSPLAKNHFCPSR